MTATAVEAWDERWATPEGRADWLVPDPAVAALVPVLKARSAQHVLDLGCGVGRHALFFAEHGFAVEAIDGAAAGLDFACREAAARGLRLSLRQADADALPFADESFDYVLSGLVPVRKARSAQHVLDLGCGVGRHALFFAEHGFAVEAIDGAAAGLDFACREAAARGLRLSLRQADADALPFADESFDYVL